MQVTFRCAGFIYSANKYAYLRLLLKIAQHLHICISSHLHIVYGNFLNTINLNSTSKKRNNNAAKTNG